MDFLDSTGAKVAAFFGVVVTVAFLFYILCLNHVSINEVGISYDSLNGNVEKQDRPGWYRTSPFVLVTYVSTLPFKVIIPSGAVVIVAKVVRFEVEGLDEYIRLQGWRYNMDSDLKSVFLGYAFSGRKYPFLVVMQEAGVEEVKNLRPIE